MTDDVTDEDFDEALTRAQDEQNVSRANVVRKVREVQSSPHTHHGAPSRSQGRRVVAGGMGRSG